MSRGEQFSLETENGKPTLVSAAGLRFAAALAGFLLGEASGDSSWLEASHGASAHPTAVNLASWAVVLPPTPPLWVSSSGSSMGRASR